MAYYYVKIGPDRSRKNGNSSKGYHFYRRGTWIYIVWGAITVSGYIKKVYTWVRWEPYSKPKIEKCRTVKRAMARLRELDAHRQESREYEKLLPGNRIWLREE
jgi:hypothetical protein